MSAPTYGERVTMALTEAGHPPTARVVIGGVAKAEWRPSPPFSAYARASELAGRTWETNEAVWVDYGVRVSLVDMTDVEHAAHCAAIGVPDLRAPR